MNLVRRRELNQDLPMHMRMAIRRRLRKGNLSNIEREALEDALDADSDAVEIISRLAQNEGITPPAEPRDWAGFFTALLAFLEKMIPILIQLFGMMSIEE